MRPARLVRDCSFCGKTAAVCIAFPAANICLECVDSCNKVMGKIPHGAISCDKCMHFKTFRARTKYGASLYFEARDVPPAGHPEYPYTEQGAAGETDIRYIVVGSNQTWAPGSKADHFLCGSCESKIPHWKIGLNASVQEILGAETTKLDKAAAKAAKKAAKEKRRKKDPEPDGPKPA